VNHFLYLAAFLITAAPVLVISLLVRIVAKKARMFQIIKISILMQLSVYLVLVSGELRDCGSQPGVRFAGCDFNYFPLS